MSKKVGYNGGSTIINTKTKTKKLISNTKSNIKSKNAKVCKNCKDNREGYCNKFKQWCSKVNYICNGLDKPVDTHREAIKKVKKYKCSKKKNKRY